MTCSCGSGGHPRRCAEHPARYLAHCNEISVESLQADVERLEAERDKYKRDLMDIAEALYGDFMKCGAKNYLELHIACDGGRKIALLIQPNDGMTPATKNAVLETEVTKLRSALEVAAEAFKTVSTPMIGASLDEIHSGKPPVWPLLKIKTHVLEAMRACLTALGKTE